MSSRQKILPADAVANRVAVVTAPALAWLLALPKFVLPVALALGLLVGLAAGGILGLVVLLVVAGVLGWLLAAFWPVTPPSGRLLRLVVVVAIALIGVLKAA